MDEKCVFTVATGKRFLHFAFALARSYRLHNHADIPFFIVSNRDFRLPRDLSWVKKHILSPELIGKGLEYRFRFYDVLPAHKSIFIDADCIIYRDVSPIFDIPNDSIKVLGRKIVEFLWGYDPEKILKEFDIPHLIHYPGAFYYLIKSKKTKQICETANALMESGFPFEKHRFSFNDEPILSISLVKHNVEPHPNTGNIFSDISQLETHKNLKVLKGTAKFRNVIETNLKAYLPEGNYSPMIVHMGSLTYNKNPWLFESLKLRLFYKYHFNAWLADTSIHLFVEIPYFMMKKIMKSLNWRD